MVSANRVAAINPPIDDTDPIRKFSIDPPGVTRTGQNKQNSLQKGSRYGISVSTPHRRYGHRLRMPFLRTPFPRLLCEWRKWVGKIHSVKLTQEVIAFLSRIGEVGGGRSPKCPRKNLFKTRDLQAKLQLQFVRVLSTVIGRTPQLHPYFDNLQSLARPHMSRL